MTTSIGQRDELPFYEGSGYWEFNAGEHNALVISEWVEQNYDSEDGWRAEAVIGLKRAVFADDDIVVAVQIGALWNSHPGGDCGEGGAEFRLLGGRAFGESGFFNVEAASRGLDGGCSGERLDLTAGYRPAENWLAMGQVFLDAPRDGEATVKAQLTAVRFSRSGRGLQVGLRARLDGDDPEPTLVLGWWGRSGD